VTVEVSSGGSVEGSRRVVVLGDGVIGTTYGLLLSEAGHEVTHLIRPERRPSYPATRRVSLLDGRSRPPLRTLREYTVRLCEAGTRADLVVVSVPDDELAGALASIDEDEVGGRLLLMTAVWETRRWLADQLAGRPYLLGYPMAGGGVVDGTLSSAVLDHVMLEGRGPGRDDVAEVFRSAGLQVESPPDMLEWIWLHVAINAGVIAVAAGEGDPEDPAEAARRLMESPHLLQQVVCTVRECVQVAAARGVRLRRYPRELLPYRLPARPAALVMRRLFARDVLARRVMELHNNARDLRELLLDVEHTREQLGVDAPLFQDYVSRAVPNLDRMLARH
jgi:2-dehydropantoate 2-reductase